jgi:peroxiredoxin family protein
MAASTRRGVRGFRREVDGMTGKPLFIVLCSGEHEKVQMAAMTASVAAVSERPVSVFVSMNAMFVFERGIAADARYRGGRMSGLLNERGAPDAVDLFRTAKDLGELTVHACSMALDVLGWDMDRLEEGVFDGPLGLTRFLSDAEEGQLVTF